MWDVIIAISCLYQGFMVPFSLCFEKIYIEKDSDKAGETEQCLFSDNVTIRYVACLKNGGIGAGKQKKMITQ